RFVGKIDRSLLDHAVDVIPPRVVIQQAIHRQLQLVMEAVQHATNAAGRLTSSMCQDAVVFAPESILVEAPPNRVFLDMKDEFCSVLFELHDVLFDDRWD